MALKGILGGTFDPIHQGHLVLAESAREIFHLDQVVFMPAGNPPHKPEQALAPACNRLRMVEIAAAGNPFFAVSPLEIERSGPSYTADTITMLQERHPGAAWCLIVGGDTLAEIPTWHDYRGLLGRVKILAASRPGSALSLPSELQAYAGGISTFTPPGLAISSTMIRDRIRTGRSIRYLVPDGVADYLYENRLYQR